MGNPKNGSRGKTAFLFYAAGGGEDACLRHYGPFMLTAALRPFPSGLKTAAKMIEEDDEFWYTKLYICFLDFRAIAASCILRISENRKGAPSC